MRIFRLMLDIALFQRGPQSLPASPWITIGAMGAYAAAGLLVHRLIAPAASPVGPVFLDLFVLTGFVMVLLFWRGFIDRVNQTLAALAGTGTLLTLCGLPVIRLLEPQAGSPALASAGVILWLALTGWSLAVTAHILRHALAVSFPAGMIWAVAYMMISVFLYGTFFGTAR